jgi:hypothetical protein
MPALPIKDMGPCEIVWGYGESGAINLGPFLGATTYKGETSVEDIQEERYANAAVDAMLSGTIATLELRMTRSTYLQLTEVLNAQYISGNVLRLRNQLGCNIQELAKQVVIKPICDGAVSTDPAEWVHIYEAYPVPGWELVWDRSTQRVFPIMFKIFVSQESGKEGDFGTMGMESGSSEFGI